MLIIKEDLNENNNIENNKTKLECLLVCAVARTRQKSARKNHAPKTSLSWQIARF